MIDISRVNYNRTDTWPSYDDLAKESGSEIAKFIGHIYLGGVVREIRRAMEPFPGCGGVGHVILISICSAIDSIAAYANGGGGVGSRFQDFINKYFSERYRGKEKKIYDLFRNDGVHGWNLHRSYITGSENDPNHLTGDICLSLYDLLNDFEHAILGYLILISRDETIKNNALKRYKEVKVAD